MTMTQDSVAVTTNVEECRAAIEPLMASAPAKCERKKQLEYVRRKTFRPIALETRKTNRLDPVALAILVPSVRQRVLATQRPCLSVLR